MDTYLEEAEQILDESRYSYPSSIGIDSEEGLVRIELQRRDDELIQSLRERIPSDAMRIVVSPQIEGHGTPTSQSRNWALMAAIVTMTIGLAVLLVLLKRRISARRAISH